MVLYILDMNRFEQSKYCTELSKHKKHHAAGQFLLRRVLGEEAYKKAEFAKGEHGKPYIIGHPVHYNISHSGEYVVLVTANSEVGVDVQEKGPVRMETLSKRFFSVEEWKAFSACQEAEEDFETKAKKDVMLTEDRFKEPKDLFYYIWCRKEAYGKYRGTGLNTEVLQTNVLVDMQDVQFIEYEAVEGYQISICCGKDESIEEVISVFEGL